MGVSSCGPFLLSASLLSMRALMRYCFGHCSSVRTFVCLFYQNICSNQIHMKISSMSLIFRRKWKNDWILGNKSEKRRIERMTWGGHDDTPACLLGKIVEVSRWNRKWIGRWFGPDFFFFCFRWCGPAPFRLNQMKLSNMVGDTYSVDCGVCMLFKKNSPWPANFAVK